MHRRPTSPRLGPASLAVLAIVLALAFAGCGGGDDEAAADTAAQTEQQVTATAATEAPPTDTAPAETGAAPDTADNPFGATLTNGEYGENYNPDPAVLDQAILGPEGLPEDPMEKNIVLAALARASTAVDEAKALECWRTNDCETGTGGELTVGLADGFGGNVARQMFKMEFILQALTYPEIGRILYTDADLDTQKAISDMRSMIAQGTDIILSYPDAGDAMLPVYRQATDREIPVALWAGANIGEPGVDYMTSTGRDYCAIGTANAEVINEALPDGGKIAFLGGTPGNSTSPQWQECERANLNDNIEVVAVADTGWTPQGALEAMAGILSAHPDLDGVSYDYGDAFVGAIRAFEAADLPLDIVATVETDENSLFCAWKDANDPEFDLWTFVAASYESRFGLTAAMMQRAGAPVPPQVVIRASLKQVDENSCREDFVANAPPSALVSAELQAQMFE